MRRSERSLGVVSARRLLTFGLVTFAWLFFRANSMGDAGTLLAALFTGKGVGFGETLSLLGLDAVNLLMTVLLILTLFMIDRLLIYGDEPDGSAVLTRGGSFVFYAWMVMLVWAILLSKQMTGTFIYFQF